MLWNFRRGLMCAQIWTRPGAPFVREACVFTAFLLEFSFQAVANATLANDVDATASEEGRHEGISFFS